LLVVSGGLCGWVYGYIFHIYENKREHSRGNTSGSCGLEDGQEELEGEGGGCWEGGMRGVVVCIGKDGDALDVEGGYGC
jgi:hypothetical protein